MSSLGKTFNTETMPTATADFAPLPDGTYNVQITGCADCANKNNTGRYLKFEYTVVGNANYNGRKVWQNINYENISSKAEEIGLAELASVMRSCNLKEASDTDQFLNKILAIKVVIKKGENGYKDSNEVKGHSVATSAPSTVTTPTPAPAPNIAAPKRPWE